MACEFIRSHDWWWSDRFTFAELRQIVKARKKGWKILKGEKYIRQTCKNDHIYAFKAIPEIHKICIKYDMYHE